VTVTLGNFLLALLVLYGFAVASWLLEQTLKHTLPSRLEAELGTVESVATLARYAVLAVGIVATLAVMGFDATSLAIVAGGLSVGIGIGLQEIVANFVSGLTLLFEQSLRPGDVIEIDGHINRVDKISLRATQVRTLDNTELIIPNATFTTAQVTSLTRGDRLIRVRLPFGVAYGSDPELVRQVATKTALQHELTLAEPSPVVLHRGFGDSALNFELGVWTNQPAQRERYRSDLYYRLQAALKEHKIEIPFPQRDLHIRSGGETVGAAQPDE
jgi:small-conductance mechanosensitive channel